MERLPVILGLFCLALSARLFAGESSMVIRDAERPGADSGKTRVRIGPCGFIEEVVVGGVTLVAPPAEGERRVIFDVLVPDASGRPGDAHRSGRIRRSAARPSECACVATRRGSAVRLAALGRLDNAKFLMRLKLVRGSPLVAVDHQASQEPAERGGLLIRCGVSFRMILDANKTIRRTGFWTGERIEDWAYGERHHASDPPRGQIGPDPKAWPFWRVGGFFRDEFGHFCIWKATGPDMGPMTMAEGESRGGWGYITDGKVFCAFGAPDDLRPSGFSFRVSNDTGEVAFYTHPPEARPRPLAQERGKFLLLFGPGDPLRKRSLLDPLLAAMKETER